MIIACYARKSTDKINDSIENQFSVIDNYIYHHNELKDAEILHFSDDGFTGINLQRDAFQELLTKVRQREIDVIVVRDLSRLGRNYLDVCKLTESIFPFMQVRLIAVSDKYDSKFRSEYRMDLPTAFMAIMNEYYAVESSKKIQKSCEARIRNGEHIGYISYGYFLSDKYTPVIDEEKAEVVREIFSMYLEGKSTLEIARWLNLNGILTSHEVKWNSGTVKHILKNENYIGRKTALKQVKDVKTRKYKPTDESSWYINENAFPPIIERDVFEKVQSMMPKQKSRDTREKSIMARKLYCAGCGRTMRQEKHFYCRNGYVTGEKACFKGSLKREILLEAVLKKVKQYLKTELDNHYSDYSFLDITKYEKELTALKEEKARIFDRFLHGGISDSEFQTEKQEVLSLIELKQEEIRKCRRMTALNTKFSSERPIDTLRRLYTAPELTREHMQFVRRIDVFDKDTFEIHLYEDSPLTVLCRNMNIYEEIEK